MPLFDDDGNVDHTTANKIYQRASSQITGSVPPQMLMPGVPVIGEKKVDFDDVVPLTSRQLSDLRKTVDLYLQKGISPNATIAMDFASYAALVKTMETMGAFQENEIGDVPHEE